MDKTKKTSAVSRVGCFRWGLRILGILIALFVLLYIIAFTVEKITLAQLPTMYPPPGQMVDIGDYSMHLYCTGDPAARPVVVVSPGSGSSVAQWALVQPEVAKFARICVYDRPGVGWSFSTPEGQTYQEEAEDVHTLLQKAGIQGPYILAGHSYGGAVMQTYAGLYPQEVAGMVMVDVVTRGIETAYPEQYQTNLRISRQVISVFSTPGVFRLMQWLGMMPATTPLFDRLPPEMRKTVYALDYNSRLGLVSKANQASFEERNVQFLSAAPLPDVPMIVIVRGKPDEIQGPPLDEETIQRAEQAWRYGHENLADQVSEGTLILAEGSGHMVIIEKPEMVIDAIRTILNKMRE